LLAQQLAPERSQSEDLGGVVDVPSFGEHLYGHDAAHRLSGLAGLAHGGDDLAELFCGL
jgi:hypothetical protein